MRFFTIPLLFSCLSATAAFAEAPKIECPVPGVPCRLLFISDNDIQMLMGERGVLSTAAQARNLDLGAYVTYFAQMLRDAPLGEVKPKEAPKPLVSNDGATPPQPQMDANGNAKK